MGIFGWYFQTSLLLRIFIALILGVVTGLIVGPGKAWVNPFGVVHVRLLQMVVLPVVVFTLVFGAAGKQIEAPSLVETLMNMLPSVFLP